MNKYYCDACKKEITDWEKPDFRQWAQNHDDIHLDLCLKCSCRLKAYLKQIGVEWL